MDHSEVVRDKAVEKYILGELSPEVRDQFEEHFFDCAECTSNLRALARFRTANRLIREEDLLGEMPLPRQLQPRPWFSWLRPAFAIPIMAGLAAIAIYQNGVTIPALKGRLTDQNTAQVYESSKRINGASRGEAIAKVSFHPNESFGLDFDFTPNKVFSSYQGSLVVAPTGKALFTFAVKGAEANKELHLVIPGGIVQPGNYQLVFVGESDSASSGSKGEEVQRLSFTLEFLPPLK